VSTQETLLLSRVGIESCFAAVGGGVFAFEVIAEYSLFRDCQSDNGKAVNLLVESSFSCCTFVNNSRLSHPTTLVTSGTLSDGVITSSAAVSFRNCNFFIRNGESVFQPLLLPASVNLRIVTSPTTLIILPFW